MTPKLSETAVHMTTSLTTSNDNDDGNEKETEPLKDNTNNQNDDEQQMEEEELVDKKKTAKSSKVKGQKSVTAAAKKTRKQKKKVENNDDDDNASTQDETDDEEEEESTSKKTTKKKTTTTTKKRKGRKKATDSGDEASPTKKTKTTKKKKKEPVQCITERDELPKLWPADNSNSSYRFKIASFNVAGLRAFIKKYPDGLAKLAKNHDLDVLCLQETKIQEVHLDDPKEQIRDLLVAEGYDAYYSCSRARKGYSGTAVFVKRHAALGSSTTTTTTKKKQKSIDSFFKKPKETTKAGAEAADNSATTATTDNTLPINVKLLVPEKVSYGLGQEKHDEEGRVIIVDFPSFSIANLYVPNSGQQLKRLEYRTDEWDQDLVKVMKEKQTTRGVPVMWLGDLNVAHKELDAYNFGAKHLDKQAGLTPQERASFSAQLEASGFVDAFRHLHPTAKGHYSYWSQRAGNREVNKGLRLDYFVCDPAFFNTDASVMVRDSYMIPEQMGSDHCPVVLELEIKPHDIKTTG